MEATTSVATAKAAHPATLAILATVPIVSGIVTFVNIRPNAVIRTTCAIRQPMRSINPSFPPSAPSKSASSLTGNKLRRERPMEEANRRGIRRLALVLSCILLTLGACSMVPGYGTKAGGGIVPLHITLATGDPPGRPASDDVIEFGRALEKLSGGSISVDVRWQAYEKVTGLDDPHASETVGKMVRDGTTELALVPDFVWIDRGAARMAALKTPFLVTTQSLMNTIATSAISGPMLGELSSFGVHGLALLPETLRHPVGFGHALLGVSDFHGQSLRSIDPLARRLFDQLGGHGVAVDGSGFGVAVSQGRIQGADSAFAQFTSLPATGIFTGDVAYFPKVNILVANQAWFSHLDTRMKAVVESAARTTLRYVIRTNPSDAESARRYCAAGGTVAIAGWDAVDAIAQAAAPIETTLRRDSVTRESIDDIIAMKDGSSPAEDLVKACGPRADTPDAEPPVPSASGDSSAFPDGTYRMKITKDAFIAAGIDEATAINHAGVWTITFRDGKYLDPGCPGSTYTVHDGRVSIVLGPRGPGCGTAAGGELFNARWTYRNGILRFLDVRGGAEGPAWQRFHEILWGSRPWQRIG